MVSTRARAPPTPQPISGVRKSARRSQPELGEFRPKETVSIMRAMMGLSSTKYLLAITLKFVQWLKLSLTLDTPIAHPRVSNAVTEQAELVRSVKSRKRRRFGSPFGIEDSSVINSSGSYQTPSQSPAKSSRCSSKDQGRGHAGQLPSSQRATDPETETSYIRQSNHIYSDESTITLRHGFSLGPRANQGSPGVNGSAGGSAAGTAPASLQLRISSLPVLDNLATQIMQLLLQHTLPDLLVLSVGQECQIDHTLVTLNSLFRQTKKVYADDRGFLPLFQTDLTEASQISTIRNANTATFFSIIFSGHDIDFQALLDYFLDSIVIENTVLKDEHSELLIETLTQACISDITKSQEIGSEKLAKYFPIDPLLDCLDRGIASQSRTRPEREHTKRVGSRRNALLQLVQSENSAAVLRQQYPWEVFLGLWHTYLQTNFGALNGQYNLQVTGPCTVKPLRGFRQNQSLQEMQQPQNDVYAAFPLTGSCEFHGTHSHTTSDNIIEKAARAAQFALENYGDHGKVKSNHQALSQGMRHNEHLKRDQSFNPPGPPIQFHFEYGLHPEVATADPSYVDNGSFQERWSSNTNGERPLDSIYDEGDIIPFPTQSAPTRILYERARLTAASKSTLRTPRKASSSGTTQRRPWTSEEEHALMAGLDRVRGPHWSQIHAMFGPSGNINKSLKDRSQVQMKDKARNLKLFFLKSNIEVPHYLQLVTGELKTRAPSRALKHRPKEKQAADEDRARVSGAMAFAGSSTTQEDVQVHEPPPLPPPPPPQTHRLSIGEPSQDVAFRDTDLTPDDNIDPSLGSISPLSRDDRAGHAALYAKMPYHAPTPNMIMQNLDRCIIQISRE